MSRLVIDGPSIKGLAKRADLRAAFPFLAVYAVAPKPGCCGAWSAGPNPSAALNAIAGLPLARIKVLKALLGVDTIVVIVVRAARQQKIER